MPKYKLQGCSHNLKELKSVGENVVIEDGAKIINPQNVSIGSNVYIGHNAILNGYFENTLEIGDNVWIGAGCFLHSAGGIKIESNVGIGPGVKMVSSFHDLKKDDLGPIINLPLKFAPIVIKKGSDLGIGAMILPGVVIEEGTQVGAGAVVTKNTSRYSIVAGVPAKVIGMRQSFYEKSNRQKINFSQIIKKIITQITGYISDIIFIGILPMLVIYSWTRFVLKRIFHLKPKILVSPLGAPLPFFGVKAIRSQGYEADNLAFSVPNYFRNVSFGTILSDYKILQILMYLTDYVFLFSYAILKYDIFEFPFSGGILMYSHWRKAELFLLKLCEKKISIYGYGSDCKVLSDIRCQGFKYNNAMDRSEETESQKEAVIRANVKRAQKYADVLIAGGDLTHFGEKGIMLPLATDLSFWKYAPMPKNKVVNIVHSTNHRSHKGTRFIIDIVSNLEKKLPIKLTLLEKKTIKECQKLYPKGDIFIPDVVTGWHGFTAIEAMATGRPVITYLREDIEKFHHYYAKDIPAISANPDNLAKVVTKLVKDQKLREDLGKKGRDYANKYHSFEFVGSLRAILYEYIWNNKKINQKIFEKEVKKRKLTQ
jgi:acetyltransferase-like isoleucine patch superfamily enzyme